MRTSLEHLHASGIAFALQHRQLQRIQVVITNLNLDKDRKAVLECKSQGKSITCSHQNCSLPRARLERFQPRPFQRLQRLQLWQFQRLHHLVITKLKLDKDRKDLKARKERKSLANFSLICKPEVFIYIWRRDIWRRDRAGVQRWRGTKLWLVDVVCQGSSCQPGCLFSLEAFGPV